MATILPFEDIVRSRRRQRQHDQLEQCIEILELNLRYTLDQFHEAEGDERALQARRLRNLSALLAYAVEQA